MEKLRYGLLGAGAIAVQHLEAAGLLTDCLEIIALCDTDEKALEEKGNKYGIAKRYTRLTDLLHDSEIDVVTVLTPPHIRQEVVIPCLKAGKHVLVEKPFALTIEEAKKMVEAAEECNRSIAVNQNYRWRPEARCMREIIDDGLIGDVLMINVNQSFWRDEHIGWRNTTDYLAISVMGVHWLDRFRWLSKDEPSSMFATLGNSGLLTSKGEDITSVTVNFKRGAIATLTHSWVSQARGEADYTEVIGSEGTIVSRGSTVRLYQQDQKEIKEWSTYTENVFVKSFASSIQLFTGDVLAGRESCISGNDNLRTMALVDGAYKSNVSKTPVTFQF